MKMLIQHDRKLCICSTHKEALFFIFGKLCFYTHLYLFSQSVGKTMYFEFFFFFFNNCKMTLEFVDGYSWLLNV